MCRRKDTGTTMAARVRGVVRPGEEVTAVMIGERMGVMTRAEMDKIRQTISWMRKEGGVKSVTPGVYVFAAETSRRTYIDKMWHAARSCRTFTAADIEVYSGASKETVLEYLRCLTRLGYLRKPNRTTWHLLKDPGPGAPVNSAKCKRLKNWRKTKSERDAEKADHAE